MNSLYQQLQGASSMPNLNNLKQMMGLFKGANNPQQLLANLVNQNPQMRQVIQLVNSSGKSPKDLFYQLAKQRGVDPNEILKQLQ